MNESDLFNRDIMFWREINFLSPNAIAELILIDPVAIDGLKLSVINCRLLPYESHKVEYDMDNGGSFLKHEVKSWHYILESDWVFYNDQNISEDERNTKEKSILHQQIQAINLTDETGQLIVSKVKI